MQKLSRTRIELSLPNVLTHSVIVAATISAFGLTASCRKTAEAQPIAASAQTAASPQRLHVEAEDGELSGTQVATDATGFSGKGYVTGFDGDGDHVTLTVEAAVGGLYDLHVHYRSTSGPKGCDLSVNGSTISGMLPQTKAFTEIALGKVELKAGSNTVVVERGWGYYDLDAIEFVPAAPAPALVRPPKTLVDKKATPAAKALLGRLVDLYGTKTLSGQQNDTDGDYIQQTIGVFPAVLGTDLMEYSPSRVEHGARPEGTTERIIQRLKTDGGVVSVMWHWNAPTALLDKKFTGTDGKEIDASWYRGFYTNATTFDIAKALADPKSKEYGLLLRDIDVAAGQLKKYQDAGIPVLWRPLHEAEGGWFWWGAKGPEPLKKLWRLMYDRMTVKHGLHNLIWVYSSGTKQDWYPGDKYVDIVGIDAYPKDYGDPLSGTWETLLKQYGGRKLLALTEFGKVPDTQKMQRYGVRWSYFMSWGGELGARGVPPDKLKSLYTQDAVINRADWKKIR